MAKLLFGEENCTAATSELSGKKYYADKQGFYNVNDAADVKFLKKGGFIEAGSMPRTSKYWECDDCSWSAIINSCPKCGSTDLRKVEV